MGLIEAAIIFLIQVAVLVGVVYLIFWALGQIGVPLPDQVVKIVWVIVALVVLLMLLRMVGGDLLSFPRLR